MFCRAGPVDAEPSPETGKSTHSYRPCRAALCMQWSLWLATTRQRQKSAHDVELGSSLAHRFAVSRGCPWRKIGPRACAKKLSATSSCPESQIGQQITLSLPIRGKRLDQARHPRRFGQRRYVQIRYNGTLRPAMPPKDRISLAFHVKRSILHVRLWLPATKGVTAAKLRCTIPSIARYENAQVPTVLVLVLRADQRC